MSHTWEPIWPLAIDDSAPDELKARVAKHAKDVAALVSARNKLDADHATFNSIEAGNLTGKVLLESAQFIARRVDLLASEIGLRDEAAEIYSQHKNALMDLRDKAFEEVESAKAAAREKFLAVGYADHVDGVVNPSRITPAMIAGCPPVIEAATRYRELDDRFHDCAFAKSNNDSRECVCKHLQQLKTRFAA